MPPCVLFLLSPLLLLEYHTSEMLNKQHIGQADISGIYGESNFHFTALLLFSLLTLQQCKYNVPNLMLKS